MASSPGELGTLLADEKFSPQNLEEAKKLKNDQLWSEHGQQDQEQFLLAQLGELDREIGKKLSENATNFSKPISCLNKLISELQGQGQQPASEFL
ncbi:unnamed protein product [Caretta caretta]